MNTAPHPSPGLLEELVGNTALGRGYTRCAETVDSAALATSNAAIRGWSYLTGGGRDGLTRVLAYSGAAVVVGIGFVENPLIGIVDALFVSMPLVLAYSAASFVEVERALSDAPEKLKDSVQAERVIHLRQNFANFCSYYYPAAGFLMASVFAHTNPAVYCPMLAAQVAGFGLLGASMLVDRTPLPSQTLEK